MADLRGHLHRVQEFLCTISARKFGAEMPREGRKSDRRER
jgi:hypothetical protein